VRMRLSFFCEKQTSVTITCRQNEFLHDWLAPRMKLS
jgi:hypothetical protein